MGTVLIVDDSKFLAKAMKRVIEELDFTVVGVGHDGYQGLELFKELRPDVTLLDITMPNMDGIDCLTEIRKVDPQARIVMLSAVQEQVVVDRCMQNGAMKFLSKPIKNDDPEYLSLLQETLDSAVAKVCYP